MKPPRPRPRSSTPPTLRAVDVARLEVVRDRLRSALRLADSLADLRAHVVELAADLEAFTEQLAAPTLRAAVPESAPSTPHDTQAAIEYGPGGSLWAAAQERGPI